jgi:hypothetical protein
MYNTQPCAIKLYVDDEEDEDGPYNLHKLRHLSSWA